MGLLSKKNIDKAKALAEKNAAKIASSVDKVTDTVDKKTKGKYSDKLQKVDDAAKKFAKDSGHAVSENDPMADDTAVDDTAVDGAAADTPDDSSSSGTAEPKP